LSRPPKIAFARAPAAFEGPAPSPGVHPSAPVTRSRSDAILAKSLCELGVVHVSFGSVFERMGSRVPPRALDLGLSRVGAVPRTDTTRVTREARPAALRARSAPASSPRPTRAMPRTGATLVALLLAAALGAARAAPARRLAAARAGAGAPPATAGDVLAALAGDGGRVRLPLCDCAPAAGEPLGLSCEREGFFVAAFERRGSWVAGGGAVPLARAICCRPCLPGGPLGGDNEPPQAPVALVSLGCHASTDALAGARCEGGPGAAGLVVGYSDAVAVAAAGGAAYPTDAARCCTPAVLTDAGEAWELERCDCAAADEAAGGDPVSCGPLPGDGGGPAAHRLLVGFDAVRFSPVAHTVPVGPARCCGVCLAPARRRPADADCAALDGCSRGRGVCALGRCECRPGWGGADCSRALGGRGAPYAWPPWAVALAVMAALTTAAALLALAARLGEMLAERDAAAGGGAGVDARRPLLEGIDEEDRGSVGSADTAGETELEEVEARIEAAAAAAAAAGEGEAAGEAEAAATPEEAAAPPEEAAAEPEAAAPPEPDGELEAGAPDGAAAAPDAPADETAADAAEKGDAGGAALASYAGVGPLADVGCAVCMVRPVQVALVPCGHVCMCRRCARRLARCPTCRSMIVRRQRLFV
jgi:hypothetical protein